MEKPSSSKTELTVLKNYFWMLLVLWTVLVGSILLWSLFRQKHETEQVARIQARSSFEKDLVYRRWAAGHGGVYVPLTDKTPPNPYLSHIEERDITTPSGRVLTLVNPAYMTRQVHEVGLEQYGSRGHITSLNTLRPANAADEWETKALQAFEQGVKEVSSIEKLDNQNYMRLMRPMITEQGCLKCHAEQGYKVGDLRGGISVSVPMAPIQAIARGNALMLAVGHFVLWLLGVGGISLGEQRLKQRIQERKQTYELLRISEANYHTIFDSANDAIFIHDIETGQILNVNKKACEIYGYTREELKKLTVGDISTGVPPYDQEHAFERIEKAVKGGPQLFEWICKAKSGRTFWVEVNLKLAAIGEQNRVLAVVRDITERKNVEEELNRQRYYLAKAQDIGSIGTWDLDIKKNKLIWTDENYRIFGVPLGTELTYELFLNCVHPDDRKYVDEKWKKALNQEPYDIEHRLLVDGRIKWVREKAEVEFNEKGNCIRGIGFTQDITERKQAQEELENLLHDMGGRVKELTCMYSLAKSIQQRETLERIFQDVIKLIPPGWHYPEITCARVCFNGAEYLSDSFKETQWKQVSDLIVDGEQCGSVEVYYLKEKPTLDEGPFLKEERNLIDGIAHALSEAIKRMSAEEQIENLAKFPSENPNPVLRIVKDGTLLYANEASQSLLDEWKCKLGQTVPRDWHETVSDVLALGSPKRIEAKHAGRILAFMVAPVVEAGYANLYGRDITDRKKAEQKIKKLNEELEQMVTERTAELTQANEQLREEMEQRRHLEKEILSISEREQKRIGQELHDSLGQQLTGIGFMVKVLEQRLAAKMPDEASDVAEIAKLVSQATEQTRNLSKGLQPVSLDTGGLVLALQELATGTEQVFGISCVFKCDRPVSVEDTSATIHLYRIAQEAVTNAIKHSKAKNIQIELTSAKDECVLTVKNDGQDFPKVLPKARGMGLQIMNYRARLINGSLDINRGIDGGTIMTCTFPNKKSNESGDKNYGTE